MCVRRGRRGPEPLFLGPFGPPRPASLPSTDRRVLHPDSRDSHARPCRRENASRKQTPYKYSPGPSGNRTGNRALRPGPFWQLALSKTPITYSTITAPHCQVLGLAVPSLL
ncbi:hypothetical protein NA56DRAFT_646902 [Hyaloscypha hepaticicola]|uniref:Uncharacterized protein n=1 Tax=Hyaloscypha hepaticicola TaxID=2082293 RepID=A0A2J6PZW0_9HELO|nr:hypothetical protein NA56DRAFT_646902 [Hyaloscypha hepaticicola]